jgi:hypothetical protein
VDLSMKEIIGCWCDGSPASNCRIRKSDGKVFLGKTTRLFEPDNFGECGAYGDPTIVPENSCDFESCATPPPSACSRADTCTVLPCNTPEFDSNGCKRSVCSNDSDCSATERCVFTPCQNSTACGYGPDGVCQCGVPEPCHPGYFCSPTAEYGPRGDWTAVEFDEVLLGGGPTHTWRLTSVGRMTMSSGVAPAPPTTRIATVSQSDLSQITDVIDGPELRRSLRDGMNCGMPPTDVNTTMKLELTTGTLDTDVTTCAYSGDNPAARIFGFVRGY